MRPPGSGGGVRDFPNGAADVAPRGAGFPGGERGGLGGSTRVVKADRADRVPASGFSTSPFESAGVGVGNALGVGDAAVDGVARSACGIGLAQRAVRAILDRDNETERRRADDGHRGEDEPRPGRHARALQGEFRAFACVVLVGRAARGPDHDGRGRVGISVRATQQGRRHIPPHRVGAWSGQGPDVVANALS